MLLFFLAGLTQVSAQSIVETIDGWGRCDFGIPQGKDKHIMLLGDSNGALQGANPVGLIGGSINTGYTKSWETFLKPGPKTGGSWRVLNASVGGMPSDMLYGLLHKCLEGDKDIRAKYLATTPDRVWLQIGGNDFRYDESVILDEFLPHLAHYRINKVLNTVGKIITMHQKIGRTVILVSYFPLQADFVSEDPWDNSENLKEGFCGMAGSTQNQATNLAGDIFCNPASEKFLELKDWLTKGIREGLDKLINLPQSFSVAGVNFPNPPAIMLHAVGTSIHKFDMWLGQRAGMSTSFTGLSSRPSKSFKALNGAKIAKFSNLLEMAQAIADYVMHEPRGIVGWEILKVMPNRNKALSVQVWWLGRRYYENVFAQGTAVAPTRYTVDLVDIGPMFLDLFLIFQIQKGLNGAFAAC